MQRQKVLYTEKVAYQMQPYYYSCNTIDRQHHSDCAICKHVLEEEGKQPRL